MNAYELADGLKKMYIENDNHGLFNKRIQNMLRQLQKEKEQQADRIAELEKERQGLCVFCKNRDLTPQTKPLSDDEILDLWCDFENDDTPVRSFARAIEERILGK